MDRKRKMSTGYRDRDGHRERRRKESRDRSGHRDKEKRRDRDKSSRKRSGCASEELSDNDIRWLVYGIALNKTLVPSARPYVESEIENEYTYLKSSHNIHTQTSHKFPERRYPKPLNYENINGNDTKLKDKKYDYSKFDYKVTSHVDFAKLFLEHNKVKFYAFDASCDASAVLNLLGKVPVFPRLVQKNAHTVIRFGRNAWGHCNFDEWDKDEFQRKFGQMKNLVQRLGLNSADERKVLEDLEHWETRGVSFCVNANIDNTLVKFMQEHVNELEAEVKNFSQSEEKEKRDILMALGNFQTNLTKLEQQVANVEQDVAANKKQIENLKTNQEILLQEVNRHGFQTYYEISSCEADIIFFAKHYHPATRQWLIEDFEGWFKDPGDSRAYVLLGDPAVGKSVMSAVLAQRATKAGYLGAAYFCLHNDGTRNNPRYLLGTIANQLCNNCSQFKSIVGGEGGIRSMLENQSAGVIELFTKLLQEPLSRCSASASRKLVVIDALDETKYKSRDDFLDLIMNRFPRLPKWLVFFITCRPEYNVRLRLKTYNPCIKICAGNSDTPNFYEQHEKDIVAFLDNKIGSVDLPCSVEEIARGCSGSFLLAYYITEEVKNLVTSGSLDQLSATLPKNIDGYFHDNFKRIFDKVGQSSYEKIFGCAVVTPSPLPISFVRYIVERENSDVFVVQSIVDAVSQFLVLRESNKTLDFLHNLIPAWLTDEDRDSSNLFIDRTEALKYFKKIVVEILSGYCNGPSGYPHSIKGDVLDFILRVGIRFLCECGRNDCLSSEVVFKCLTNYQFIVKRMKTNKVGIYSLIEDVNLSVVSHSFDDKKKQILQDLGSALTRDIYVLLWCPDLLRSCLRNASQKLSEQVIIPDYFATSLIESISSPRLDFVLDETFTTMNCFALSHDKNFFAGGNGQCIYLFDAYSLRTVQGPIQVMDEGDITCVAFSPDDNHVFFGRLDRWLSLQEQRTVKVANFSRNSYLYKWGCFIRDSNYIVVERSRTKKHNRYCLSNIFCNWSRSELLRDEPLYPKKWNRSAHSFILSKRAGGMIDTDLFSLSWPSMIPETRTEFFPSQRVCRDCRESKVVNARTLVNVYAEIFDQQVWNLQTGNPVIKEIFSSGKTLDPSLFSCHIPITIARARGICFLDTPGFSVLADSCNCCQVSDKKCLISAILNGNVSVVTPVEYRNHILKQEEHSQNGEWSARYTYDQKVQVASLVGGVNKRYDIYQVEHGGFSSDNCAFVYRTRNQNQDLYALSLQTGNILHSVSGLHILRVPLPTEELAYIFRGNRETIIMHIKDLPTIFFNLFKLQLSRTISIGATFISEDTIMCLSSTGIFGLSEIKGKDSLEFHTISSLAFPSLKEIHINKCAFAAGCDITAIHTNSEIAVSQDGEFLCPVIEKIGNYSVRCMRFSPDGRLLLFCLNSVTRTEAHVWDVQSRRDALPGPIKLRYMPLVDCCCFSPDNTKMFFCDKYSVQILEYAEPSKHSRIVGFPGPGREIDNCTHCTVSSVSEVPTLACCVAEKIFVYPLTTTGQRFREVPHGHSGRVEFCEFLKGNRFLISYGVDGFVFLTDLSQWKSIAYARAATGQESIVSIAVSPKEDKVICLKSNGDLSVISLHGLTSEVLSKLQLPELDRTQSGKQLELGIQNEFVEDDMIVMSDSDFSDSDEYESESNEYNNEDTK